jgi:hypothetical protein
MQYVIYVFRLKFKNKVHKTTILSIVLYGRESWSPILREVHRLRVFENRMLRIILGCIKNEIISLRNVNN